MSGMWGTIARSWTTPGMFFSLRRSHPHGSEFTPVISLPVKTATTPGCFSAALASILRIFACACWLRTNAAYVMPGSLDRKSTRLNSSHGYISYAVFCLKKKKTNVHPRHKCARLHVHSYVVVVPVECPVDDRTRCACDLTAVSSAGAPTSDVLDCQPVTQ